jgi:rSAM/selenodomain-associated transferase 2
VVDAPRGRALQMNAGAARARADALLFLHADTRLPPMGDELVLQALAGGACWGRFDVRIEGRPWMLRVVAALMNLRSRASGIATGDQAIFVTREAFERVGGFPVQPLMEDIEISRRLKRLGRPACLGARVCTSGRRWEQRGVWRTILLMWRLRWRYWRGESAAQLAQAYR